MARRRGAPRLTEREDPLSFVLRNRPAREVLERLQGQPLMIPMTLRKSISIHPEAFRRLVLDMNEFALVSIRALPQTKSTRERRSRPLNIPVGLELTSTGEGVLEMTRQVRELVRRHPHLVPDLSAEHWLSA